MKPECHTVIERIALGEPLGDLADHAASCDRCRSVVALPAELGAAHRDVDPGLGFSARMTAGAQHLVIVRRRRRLATGLAIAVAASVVGVVFVTHQPAAVETARPTSAIQNPTQPSPPTNPEDQDVDPEVHALVHYASAASHHESARWDDIEKPLAPYRELLEGNIEP